MDQKKLGSPEVQIIETEDGSSSLYIPLLNETYHSFHGALTESNHVFIKQGLKYWQEMYGKAAVNVLEVGFGTGLNAMLSVRYALENHCNIFYETIEAYPLSADVIHQLNYPLLMKEAHLKELFYKIHKIEWGTPFPVVDFFTLLKQLKKLEEYRPENNFYDVVFFDAFAPNKQAELWEIDILKKMYDALTPAGVFVTYCAKGQLKRDLKTLGFEVQTLPGPPGKKEMVRAIKPDF